MLFYAIERVSISATSAHLDRSSLLLFLFLFLGLLQTPEDPERRCRSDSHYCMKFQAKSRERKEAISRVRSRTRERERNEGRRRTCPTREERELDSLLDRSSRRIDAGSKRRSDSKDLRHLLPGSGSDSWRRRWELAEARVGLGCKKRHRSFVSQTKE